MIPDSTRPEYTPNPQDLELFWREGVAIVRGVFADWVHPLQIALQRNLERPKSYAFPCHSVPDGETGIFFDSYCNWHRMPEYQEFLFNSCVASMAGKFMSSSTAQFFHEHAFVKGVGTQMATPWHHDLPYYCVDGTQTVSIYISLDRAPADTTVRFVAGSHRWQELFFPRHFIDGSDYRYDTEELCSAPDIERHSAQFEIRTFAVEPGDALLFNYRTLHGTTNARNRDKRRAVAFRWIGDDVVYCHRPGETSPPMDGMDLEPGDKLREDWFPVLWRANEWVATK